MRSESDKSAQRVGKQGRTEHTYVCSAAGAAVEVCALYFFLSAWMGRGCRDRDSRKLSFASLVRTPMHSCE